MVFLMSGNHYNGDDDGFSEIWVLCLFKETASEKSFFQNVMWHLVSQVNMCIPCHGGTSSVCSWVFPRGLCVFPLLITRSMHQTPTAMSSHMRRLPSLGGHWLIYKSTSRNPCVLNILFAPSWFPFILLHLKFCNRKLTSTDLLAPMSLLLWLGSTKGRYIMRQQGVREVTWFPPHLLYYLTSPFRLDYSLAGAAFLYYTSWLLSSGSPTASSCVPMAPSGPKDSSLLLVLGIVSCLFP